MRIFNFSWGPKEYTSLYYFLIGINSLLNLVFGLVIQYYPFKNLLKVKMQTVILLNLGLVFLTIALYLRFPACLTSTGSGQIAGIASWLLLFLPLALYLLKDYAAQVLFVTTYMLCAASFISGIVNFLEFWLADILCYTINTAVSTLCRISFMLAARTYCCHCLQKLFSAWKGSQKASFWLVVWIIPSTLFILNMLSVNALTLTVQNSGKFLITRLLSFIALISCMNLMTDIIVREGQLADAKIQIHVKDMENKAIDYSKNETLLAWKKTNTARKKARTIVENVLKYAQTGNHAKITETLNEYMEILNASAAKQICENTAVNALASHYASIAAANSIDIRFQLDIPKQMGHIQNLDLSRITGNMLENAIEACIRADNGNKFITLKSILHGNLFILVMNNSFDGNFQNPKNGQFVSAKRKGGIATGLSSIQTVAEKYHGTALFETEDLVFKTSVRLNMRISKKT